MRFPGLSRTSEISRKMFSAASAAGRHPKVFLRHLARQLVAFDPALSGRGFDDAVHAAVEERLSAFMSSPPAVLLLSRSLHDICGLARHSAAVPLREPDSAELPRAEQDALIHLSTVLTPRLVFEIGTYRGRTTRLLAECFPAATVHTLDLPPQRMVEGGCFREPDATLIGSAFTAELSIRSRIVQHYGDSRTFDFSSFHRRVDLVFVDASHAYEAVLSDSRRAFDMLSDQAVVLWDDYHPAHGPGVMRALGELSAERKISWIRGTRLAISLPPGTNHLGPPLTTHF